MAQGYTRNDTSNNIATGNIINATDLDGEFDALQSAFDATSGHNHDGTVGGGSPISTLGPTQEIVVTTAAIRPSADNTIDLGTSTLEFKDLYIDGTANIDSLVADTADINGGTIDNATIATSNITVGAGKTLDVSAGTLTLANDQISGDKVEGGTIAATTITTLTSTTVNATTVDTTNLEVTTLQAKDGTTAGTVANTTGVVTITSLVATTADVNGGTVDGTTIGASVPAAGTFTTVTASGDLTIADKIVHDGDTNTSIRFPAADTVTVETSGAERLRIDSSGNVGIGTSVPSDYNASADNLVVGTTSGNNGITIAAGTASQGSLFFADGTANATEEAAGYLIYVHSDDSMRVGTANTERMRIDSSGNVGIGNTAPSAKLMSQVNTFTDADKVALKAYNAQGVGAYASFQNSVTGTAFTDGFRIGIDDSENAVLQNLEATNMLFATSATERMRIDSSGNVGIGTSSPSTKLDVNGAANVSGNLTVGGVITNATFEAYKEEVITVGTVSTSTYSINTNLANIFDITLGNNVTFTFTNPPSSGFSRPVVIILRQDGTGNRTATFTGAKYTEAQLPTLSTGAGDIDVLTFFTIDGGTSWFGTFAMANVS